MTTISIAAEAAQEIYRRIASGELEVHGILLRNTSGKRFTHILRGMENLTSGASTLTEGASLAPLQAAMSVQQFLGVVSIAQNAAAAASLKRIEAKLEEIDQRLSGIEERLRRVERTVTLVLAATRQAPISRLKAAKGAAFNARRSNETAALIIATKDAEQAARDLLSQAIHLVRVKESGIPVGLLAPRELADLMHGAAEAMSVASALHISLGSRDMASRLMHETADAIEDVRKTLRTCLSDPEFMIRRIEIGIASDAEISEAGAVLRQDQQWTRGRAVLIDSGLYGPSLDPDEFATIAPLDRDASSEISVVAFEALSR